jgi:hypothetical protein
MNKIQHSEIASTAFQIVLIAAMAVLSAISMMRGAGLMG